MRTLNRLLLKVLVAVAGFLVSTSLFKWLSAYQEAVVWDIFSGDISEDSPVRGRTLWWCKAMRGLK